MKRDNKRGLQFSIQANLLQNKRKCNVGNKFERQNELLNIIDVNVMHLTNLLNKCKHRLKGCFEVNCVKHFYRIFLLFAG